MKKVRHDKTYPLKYEGQVWIVNMAEWHDGKGGGELRIYAVHGDVSSDLTKLHEALELEAATRGLSMSLK